jgi:hypothetical protein
MFELTYEQRLASWRNLRDCVETAQDPIQEVIDFYSKAPLHTIAADPYTPSTWPDPWELLEENNYCAFVKILAICYTLQLTDVLSQASYMIHIVQDKKKSATHYLLHINNRVVGFKEDTHVHAEELPPGLHSLYEYRLPNIQ